MSKRADVKEDLWRRRITQQRGSGRSIRAWCRGNQVAEHSFYWWRTRLGLSAAAGSNGAGDNDGQSRLSLAQVVVSPSATEFAPIHELLRLRLRGGHELVLPASMSIEQMAALVRAVEAEP